MCDYSLHHVQTRPAAIGDRLVTTVFQGTLTRGFCPEGDERTAVCLKPGTEIAFRMDARHYVEEEGKLPADRSTFHSRRLPGRVARFRQVNTDNAYTHHDALEFPDGEIIMVTDLCEGAYATVLQLPADPGGGTGTEKAEWHAPVIEPVA